MATTKSLEVFHLNRENVLKNVRLCVQPKSKEQILKMTVWNLPDLEVYWRFVIDDEGEVLMSFKLPEGILDSVPGLTYDELYEAAKENTKKALSIMNFGGMIIIGAVGNNYLASAILFTDKFKEICEKTEAEKLIIIPSSVHELICHPIFEGEDLPIETFNEMVRSVNATTLQPEEILSDHVYVYDNETGNVTMDKI